MSIVVTLYVYGIITRSNSHALNRMHVFPIFLTYIWFNARMHNPEYEEMTISMNVAQPFESPQNITISKAYAPPTPIPPESIFTSRWI